MWFTEPTVGQLGHASPAGRVEEHRVTTPEARLTELVAAPDGALWFIEHDADRVGRRAPDGTVAEYDLLTEGGDPTALTVGPDGEAWLLERVCRMGQCTTVNLVRVRP